MEDRSSKQMLHEIVRFVPYFTKLIYRLVKDPAVSWLAKLPLFLLVAYLACPIDLIPDFIPVIGYADDLVMIVLVLGWVFRLTDPLKIKEHWDGEADPVEVVDKARSIFRQLLRNHFRR